MRRVTERAPRRTARVSSLLLSLVRLEALASRALRIHTSNSNVQARKIRISVSLARAHMPDPAPRVAAVHSERAWTARERGIARPVPSTVPPIGLANPLTHTDSHERTRRKSAPHPRRSSA